MSRKSVSFRASLQSLEQFLREYTRGLRSSDVRHLFERDAANAFAVLIREHAKGPEPEGRYRRFFFRARLLFLGLSYKLSPPRRLLFAHSYQTANEVGGDSYDVTPLPDGRLALLVADASGHGMAAGLVMAIANATWKTALDLDPNPERVLEASFTAEEITVEAGDLLVLYTDGLVEALNPAGTEAFGYERLSRLKVRGFCAKVCGRRLVVRGFCAVVCGRRLIVRGFELLSADAAHRLGTCPASTGRDRTAGRRILPPAGWKEAHRIRKGETLPASVRIDFSS